MPALSNATLYQKLRSALPRGTEFQSAANEVRPAVLEIPAIGRIRVYLWTVTADRSADGARPPGEFKVQLILPDQPRGARGALNFGEMSTFLLGYSPDYGVFVGWEAQFYADFAYSRNVQAREEMLQEARNCGWAVAPARELQNGREVRVAFTPGNLNHFIRNSIEANVRELSGMWREAFFLSHTPNIELAQIPIREEELEEFVEVSRRRVTTTRATRDSRFSPNVKAEFDFSCAVCRLQLEIVESAHIIPVYEPESTDQIWNGIALCPNHHRLFDARAFVVSDELRFRTDPATVAFLRESEQANGIELLTNFDGEIMLRPRFWNANDDFADQMRRALRRRAALAGLD